MFRFDLYKKKNFNFQILFCVLALSVIGVLILNSAMANDPDRQSTIMKQIGGLAVGIAIMLALTLIDYHFMLRLSPLIMLGTITMLALVLTSFGHSTHGATRWLKLGVTIQPSEFAKILLILFLS